MMQIKQARKTFNPGTVNEKRAIAGVDLSVEEGDFITVIGGNGAGKSTLLNLISGTYPLDSGEILLNSGGGAGDAGGVLADRFINIGRLPEHKRARYVARVFQDPMMGTCGGMEIQENLALAYRRGKPRTLRWAIGKSEKELYHNALKRLDLGLESRMSAKVKLLSGGQRQALTLLMATLQRPDVLLLDEHTAALDPKTAARVQKLTTELTEESNITTVMITHNMRDAIKYGNRLIMMNEGNIIYEARGQEKAALKVEDLLRKFESNAGGQTLSDRMILG
ncbi:MAG: ABC transporter ATP-binding protein [Clostridiales bacterium]|nr:ABC transporter ATP-binding protein [Clostridiales bacterium]